MQCRTLTVKKTVEDLDHDFDWDIVIGRSPNVSWLENTNGMGQFTDSEFLFSTTGRFSGADFDQDGDIDLLNHDKIFWQRPIGDANDDGVFNSRDLVKVFIAGEYEDHLNFNSSYDEGDWNGDKDFTARIPAPTDNTQTSVPVDSGHRNPQP